MKRIIALALIAISCAVGALHAQPIDATADSEAEYLRNLRKKLSRLKKEMDLLIRDVTSSTAQDGLFAGLGDDLRVDIAEDDRNVLVKADLPGMDKDRIDITLERGRILKIKGSRDSARKEERAGVVRQERFAGSFERVIELPVECLNDGIKATYTNGVLEILIPKRQESKDSAVKINVL